MFIRAYTPADHRALTALWEATEGVGPVDEYDLHRLHLATPDLVLVAERDGEIVGVVLGQDDGRRGWIFRLAVAAHERGQGTGKALVREVEQRLRARGCRGVRLLVFSDNLPARGFWSAMGYDGPHEVVMYGRSLEPAAEEPAAEEPEPAPSAGSVC